MRVLFPFFSRAKRKRNAAGAFVDRSRVRYVQAAIANGGDVEVLRTFELGLDGGGTNGTREDSGLHARYERALALLHRAGAPQDVPVAFALPAAACAIKIIEGQGLVLEEARLSVHADFARYFSFSEAEAACDVAETFVPEGAEYRRAFLLAAARREHIEALTAACEKYGYIMGAVEPEQIALARACDVMCGEKGPCVLTLFAADETLFCLLSVGGEPFFFQSVEFGGIVEDSLREVLRTAFVQYPEMEVREVRVLCHASTETAKNAIKQLCPYAEIRCRPFDEWTGLFRTENAAPWFVPYGLALRGVCE